MASPVAHSLAGALIYLACNGSRKPRCQDMLAVMVAANLADLDLVPGLLLGDHGQFHRGASHSLLFAILLGAAASAWLYWRQYPRALALGTMITLALLSQLLVDWLSFDASLPQGIPLLWPFTDQSLMSPQTIFLNIRRDNLFTMPVLIHDLKALIIEALLLGPPTWWIWQWRRRQW
jgi:inner membrane protein